MDKLNYAVTCERPYTFVSAVLAPKGSYYVQDEDRYPTVYPVMYIQFWRDDEGCVWPVPLWEEELRERYGDTSKIFTIHEFIEGVINEERCIEQCMTCDRFITLCRKAGGTGEAICDFMDSICDYVISGDVAVTPALLEYFRKGIWGNLRTMENDGSLSLDWDETIKPDGSLKDIQVLSVFNDQSKSVVPK